MSHLNSFETQLLDDLKQRQSAPRAPRRTGLIASGALLAAVVAGAIAVPALVPVAAYAVEETSDGAIRITLVSLSDAEGLEDELAKHGIEATVDYDAAEASAPVADVPVGDAGAAEGTEQSASATAIGPDGEAVGGSDSFAEQCGVDPTSAPRVQFEGEKAVIVIPEGSIPDDRSLQITTAGGDSFASLSVGWVGENGACGVASASVGG